MFGRFLFADLLRKKTNTSIICFTSKHMQQTVYIFCLIFQFIFVYFQSHAKGRCLKVLMLVALLWLHSYTYDMYTFGHFVIILHTCVSLVDWITTRFWNVHQTDFRSTSNNHHFRYLVVQSFFEKKNLSFQISIEKKNVFSYQIIMDVLKCTDASFEKLNKTFWIFYFKLSHHYSLSSNVFKYFEYYFIRDATITSGFSTLKNEQSFLNINKNIVKIYRFLSVQRNNNNYFHMMAGLDETFVIQMLYRLVTHKIFIKITISICEWMYDFFFILLDMFLLNSA